MRRTKAEAEQTRQTILDTALQLFDEKGYEGTSLVQIAEAAGTTRGAIYWHFKDKADILSALGEAYLTPHTQSMEKALTHDNSWQESCETLTQLLMKFEDPQHLRLIHICYTQKSIANEDSDINKWLRHYKQIWHVQLQALIQRAMTKNEIPANTNPELAFLTIICVFRGLTEQYADILTPNTHIQRYAPQILRQTFANIAQGQCCEPTS